MTIKLYKYYPPSHELVGGLNLLIKWSARMQIEPSIILNLNTTRLN